MGTCFNIVAYVNTKTYKILEKCYLGWYLLGIGIDDELPNFSFKNCETGKIDKVFTWYGYLKVCLFSS